MASAAVGQAVLNAHGGRVALFRITGDGVHIPRLIDA